MKRSSCLLASVALGALLLPSCVAATDDPMNDDVAAEPVDKEGDAVTSSKTKYVFVIAMENHDSVQIYGNTKSAPYLNNTLIPGYASASNFNDELPALASEPHYVWMEAGTNAFSDHTFTTDHSPSSSNSTSSPSHLTAQIKAASNGVTWMSYQEGINATTGACPIAASGFYHPKHDPFVFFKDISGNGGTPSKTDSYCAAHHKDLSVLKNDLANKAVKNFNFITPNLCNDMHGATGCPSSDAIKMGDDWLKSFMPSLIKFCNENAGVVFITWDEGDNTGKMPFLAVGPNIKSNFISTKSYTHSSLLKSVEQILALPVLSKVSAANNFSDFFVASSYP